MTIKKAKPTKHAAAVKRVRRRLRYINPRLTPEEMAEDKARADARTAAYKFLTQVVNDTCIVTDLHGTLDQQLEAARILVGGTY